MVRRPRCRSTMCLTMESPRPVPPSDRLRVLLEPGDGDDDRVVSVDAVGISWAERRDALVAAVDG